MSEINVARGEIQSACGRAPGVARALLVVLLVVLASLAGCKQGPDEAQQAAQAAPGEPTAIESHPVEETPPGEAPADEVAADEAVAEATPAPRALALGNLDEEGELTPEVEARTLRLALNHPPLTFDPALVTDANSAQFVLNTFEGLMSFDAGSGPVVPGIAERYEVSDEGRTYTFYLREDARWSNGDPVTAFDFEYAWKRVLEPATASQYAWIMTDVARIAGARDFHAGRGKPEAVGITALDRHRLQVRLEVPLANFVEMTALFTFAPMHRATLEAHGEAWTRADHWVSNGPFLLVSHREDRRFVLRKNPEYWDADNVGLERVSIRVIEGDQARLDAFQAGLIDWTGPTSVPVSPRQRERLEFQYHQDPFLAVEYLAFNTAAPPLDDVRVRQALALAIDRQELVVKVLERVGRPAGGFVPPMPGFRSQVTPRTDLARARALLAEAGYDTARPLPTLRYSIPRGNSTAAAMARLIQDQLEAGLGVGLELVELDYDALNTAIDAQDFQIARQGWVADYISPSAFLSLWASTSQQNSTAWKSATYDDLLDHASRTADRTARLRLYEQAEQLLAAEMPIAPLVYYEQTYVLSEKFTGLEPHVLSIHLLKYVRPAE